MERTEPKGIEAEPHPPSSGRAPARSRSRMMLLLGAASLIAGCGAAWHEGRVDRRVYALLDDAHERVVGNREETVLQPAVAEPPVESTEEEEATETAPGAAPVAEPRVLSLRDALSTAVGSNRDYETRLEGLYLDALRLADTRHVFSPQLSLVLSYLFRGSNVALETNTAAATFGASQILPWGGRLTLDAGSGFTDVGGDGTFDSGVSISLTQPLLRGGGHEVSHEPLVQAERDLMYSIRDFELFREDFSIDVASRFYDLVGQRRLIENQRKNLEDFVFDRRRAEALFEVGRAAELDVLRARRNELNSQNALIAAEESYQEALDRFRIFLGLPVSERFDVAPEEPAFVEVHYDPESAVEVALENRLDVLNRRGQLEDAERGVRIAKDSLLPDLTLDLSYGRDTRLEPSFLDQRFQDDSVTAGLTFDAPVDRVLERSAFRRSQISLAQAERSFEEFVDGVRVDVESAFRELHRRQQSLEIQRELIGDEERNVRIARLRFEQGEVSNRDVVEAQQSLLDAKNELIREQVNYEISRLRLLRDLGILFIDDNGMWKE